MEVMLVAAFVMASLYDIPDILCNNQLAEFGYPGTRHQGGLQPFGIPFRLFDMTNVTNAIADRVRGISAEKRYTQERTAQTLGLARSSVSARLSGSIPFTAAELLTLAVALGVRIERFFPSVEELADEDAA